MKNNIIIEVETAYDAEQSEPKAAEYVYTYTIRIINEGDIPAQLLRRHWIITDANDHVQEVEGLGVIGEQPVIAAGSSYSYTSGAVLKTETGIMTGTYTMQSADGETFEAEIPAFSLVQPLSLH